MSDQPIHILLVEDNPTDALLLREALARFSSTRFKLSHEERLGDALEHLSQESCDVVLLDLGLPDSQGLETLVKMREQAPRVPIVVLTGLTDETLGLKALQQRAQDYLVKGQVETNRLARVIDYAIERARVDAEIRQRNRELSLLNQVIAACSSGLEPRSILETVCRELALAFQTDHATATLFNEEKTAVEVVAEYRDQGQPSVLGLSLPVAGNAPVQHILRAEGPFMVNKAQDDPRLAPLHELLRQSGITSLLALPLRVDSNIIGCLSLETSESRIFSATEVSLAWSVADQVAGALARARLTQVHQRLSAAVEQGNDTVIITDTAGIILYVNPAFERTSGYSQAEVTGRTPRMMKSGQHDDAFYQELWTSISAGQVWRGRFVNKKKDGTLYTEDASITPVRNESDLITTYVSVQHDVSRELELEEQYRQAQKMEAIGRLSGGVAHDFNNLLVVITGYSELLLQRHLNEQSPLYKYVEEIKKAGDSAAGLTRQLLAFSRSQVLQPRILNLNEVIVSLEKMLRRLIGEDIDLVAVPDPNLGQVKADPGQIEQVILNLVVNARDAMPQGGKLTLETANVELDEIYTGKHVGVSPGQYVMLAVSDTGLGMDAKTQSHIFEPFFTTKEQGKGTGLGLATVFGIVKQSGGDIWVYSEPGQGTTFKIYLPRVDEAVAAVEPHLANSELLTGAETVLLVEDEVGVRTLARRALELSGYTVLEASHGQEALLLFQQQPEPIHLLVTDVVMPGGLNGRELAERLKPLYPDLKVLFMSGYTNEAIVHHGVLEPGLFFLQKPFTPYVLIKKVRDVLDTPITESI
jgi:PAS domain S-box-containing protein